MSTRARGWVKAVIGGAVVGFLSWWLIPDTFPRWHLYVVTFVAMLTGMIIGHDHAPSEESQRSEIPRRA